MAKKKVFRYRKKSLKTTLGVTKAKRTVRKNLGVHKVTKFINTPKKLRRKIKRKAGYESEPMKFFRYIKRAFK